MNRKPFPCPILLASLASRWLRASLLLLPRQLLPWLCAFARTGSCAQAPKAALENGRWETLSRMPTW
jgi:hypothetical protein